MRRCLPRRPPPALVPLALATAAVLLTASACGTSSGSGPGQGGPTSAPTVTVTATEAPSSAASSPAGVPATSSPRATRGPADEGACTDEALTVRYADDPGGAGAGNVSGTLTFTNRSSETCTLRGFPGVSYVAGTRGTQVGQPATRTGEEVTTRTVEPGGSARAALRRSQPRNYGDACDETDVAGFRVYAPGATDAVFVEFPTAGCRSVSAPLLQVGPVR